MKKLLLSMAVAGLATMPVASQAGSLGANVAIASDYYSKGVDQTSTAGLLKGDISYSLDNGLYAGVWAGSLDKGYEFDLFAGWAGSFGKLNLDISYMTIYLTDDAWGIGTDAITEEILVRAGYGIFSAGVDINVDSDKATAKDTFVEDYTHYKASVDVSEWANGVSLTYGLVDYADSQDVRYFEATYATEIDKGVGFEVDFINSTKEAGAVVVTLSKSFDLM
ncbi:TorF family putative porin [Thiomicrorhabdus sediminis]|uniref:Outer membrane protein beta-barrel domain-containing protein n=1 Tax=Thiomicrorhabdus sediminis TaxID=2580412 RepID=A0A4P9K8K2_9GAMM|nr:TorF family putative porin [Thiomicrorhabdus sediminis]QCU90790.1 hypothetical protein FE785_09190 [Thiomicrorhabdus sediminis]